MSVEKILARLRDEVTTLTAQAEASVREERAKVGPVLAAMAEGQRGMKAMKRYPTAGYFNNKHGEGDWKTPESAEAWVKSMSDQCAAIRVENAAAEKHNASLATAAIEYCTLLGFPHEQYYTTGTGRKEKTHKGEAEWLHGLRKLAPRDEGWNGVEYTLRGWTETLYKWRQSIRDAEEQRQATFRKAAMDKEQAERERARIEEKVRQELTGQTPQQQRNEALAERIRATVPVAAPVPVPAFETPGQALEID